MRAPPAGAGLGDWLGYQGFLHPKTIALGLERVGEVAARLGLPSTDALTLTIGGTNGKGSSANLAALIYREAGYRVGLYTSPHLLRYNERVAIDGVEAGDAELCAAFVEIERGRGSIPLTYFEFGTLAALWLFREQKVEAQILEVGLGGRLDAVNLVDARAALVTNVGLDHTDWLGTDRESIAREKAAIFRAQRPAICTDLDPPQTITESASRVGAKLLQLGADFHIRSDDLTWDWLSRSAPHESLQGLPLPALRGDAQVRNAAGVIAMIQSMQHELPVPESAIRGALRALKLPGRFDVRGATVFDVAHNTEAAEVLAANLDHSFPLRRVQLVLGMLDDKPCADFLARLTAKVDKLHLAGLSSPRGLSAGQLKRRIGKDARDAVLHGDVAQALRHARSEHASEGIVVVTGSFLTVAAGLMVNG
ncbi:MAG: bifunctional tetrahydrofolate synthase/dihydrofolate synthase [Panacagrimonas sp.]